MSQRTNTFEPRTAVVVRRPVSSYFALVFAISWMGALAVVAPKLVRGQPVPKFAGLMMFPVMLLGPSVGGIVLTRMMEGPAGLRDLFARMLRLRVPIKWYGGILIPPVMILCILYGLATFVSPVYLPNRFFAGVSFGVVAGFFEEIGWMGFAFPRMVRSIDALPAAALLGVVWALWHLPVVDYLGTATPHGNFWLSYFFAFAAAMSAMRVLIAWIYTNTQSVALAQLMHASSTGALVVLSPSRVTAVQEAVWYATYAAGLWIIVAFVAWRFGKSLRATRQVERW